MCYIRFDSSAAAGSGAERHFGAGVSSRSKGFLGGDLQTFFCYLVFILLLNTHCSGISVSAKPLTLAL